MGGTGPTSQDKVEAKEAVEKAAESNPLEADEAAADLYSFLDDPFAVEDASEPLSLPELEKLLPPRVEIEHSELPKEVEDAISNSDNPDLATACRAAHLAKLCKELAAHLKPLRYDSSREEHYGYEYESLAPNKTDRHMEPFLVTLEPSETEEERSTHDGQEFIFVLNGEMEVRLDEEVHILEPGDSIYYDSTVPHLVKCHGKESTKILAVLYAGK